MHDDEQNLKARLARAHRILAVGGMLPLTKGHVSVRAPGRQQILILSHIHAHGRTLDTTTPEDICTIDFSGEQVSGAVEPVGERYMHTAILSHRSDINSVLHCHSPYATALSASGVSILPIGRRGAPFYPCVPILDFDGQIDTSERGQRLVETFGRGCALVLKNHGMVVGADTIENAVILAFALEDTAHLHSIALAGGTPQGMSEAESRSTMTGHRREEYFDHVWQYYLAMDPHPGSMRDGALAQRVG